MLVMVAVLAGCGGSGSSSSGGKETAKPKEPIKLGGIFDITGGTGDVGAPYADGVKDYIKYINSKGGVNGRQINLIDIDYAYQIPKALDAYKKLTTQDKVVAILGWGTGDTEAMVPLITKDKIPFMSASYSEHLLELSTHPYNFLIAQSYSDQLKMVLKWIKDNWKDTSRKPRAAFIYNDTGFGLSPIADGEKYAAEVGVELVDKVNVPLTALDATSQLTNMQKKNPDFAIIQETGMATATVLKDAKRLKLPTKFIGLNWAFDEKVIKLAGEAAEGYVGVVPFAFASDDIPAIKPLKEATNASGKKWDERTQKYVQGWATAMVMVEGLKRAGDDLSGEGIKKALEGIQNFDTGGLAAPVSFSSSSHRGSTQARLYEVKGGKFVPLTGWLKSPGR
ncbi:MAG: ABC transporter substrate-binding protein [Firmicutes bacterium]|nr:ABC transporter substrate-binding protein [Bacillota bacterium]MCL5038810.1 ABC transporter substrate-binding protein [Bacillota bacterium]